MSQSLATVTRTLLFLQMQKYPTLDSSKGDTYLIGGNFDKEP